ncbi:MAG: sulfatase-like hydrolase/transferase [Planctomycetes bacterium]|nr:sulfatase-like hydrolase/transferase [Planctomycetota bacterium]
MSRLGKAAVWLLALGLLHLVAILPLPFTAADPWRPARTLSPDLAGLLGLAVLGAASGRARGFAHAAAVLLLAAALFRSAAVYLHLLLDRRLDLKFDALELPGLLHLLTQDGAWPTWAAGIAIGLAVLATHCLLAWAFAVVAAPARRPRGAMVLLVALQALVLAGVARQSLASRPEPLWHESMLWPLAGQVGDAIDYWRHPAAVDDPIRARFAGSARELAAVPGQLAGLGGADVHLLFIESYGRYAWREPGLAPRLQALARELEDELRAAGFGACSGTCRPANSGGASWLAHAQLLCGTRVDGHRAFQLLFESDIEPLPRRFRAAGYRTVEVLPAMPRQWPEGQRFYGFDEVLTQIELDYRGFVYHWGRMPDQFALHHLLEQVVRPAQQPLFTMFVSVTSHVPWRMVPHYIADWRLEAATFAAPPRIVHPVTWLDVPYDPRLVPAFGDTLEYALRAAVGFVARLPRPSLVFVLGDHQPPIAGVGSHPDPSLEVPIHVFANRPALLEPITRSGFVGGITLDPDATSFDTSRFAASLLQLYSR